MRSFDPSGQRLSKAAVSASVQARISPALGRFGRRAEVAKWAVMQRAEPFQDLISTGPFGAFSVVEGRRLFRPPPDQEPMNAPCGTS